MKTEETSFTNNKNKKISVRIYSPDSASKKGVIFCHGLFSSKESVKIKSMVSGFVNAGYTLFTFDFSFAGESGDDFSNLSFFQELEDLKMAINFFKKYNIESFHIIGSSMGGIVTLMYAAETKEKIASLSVIATPYNLADIISRISRIQDFASLSKDGMTDISGIFIKNSFFHEVKTINMPEIITRVQTPTQILHGSNDELIDLDSIKEFYAKLSSKKELNVIEGGDHSLGRKSDIDFLQKKIIKWIQSHD